VNQKAGIRWNARKAFLDPVKSRRNLQVVTGAEAQAIVFEGRRAVGVQFASGHKPRSRVRALR
jgi:choline dehydrogenase